MASGTHLILKILMCNNNFPFFTGSTYHIYHVSVTKKEGVLVATENAAQATVKDLEISVEDIPSAGAEINLTCDAAIEENRSQNGVGNGEEDPSLRPVVEWVFSRKMVRCLLSRTHYAFTTSIRIFLPRFL